MDTKPTLPVAISYVGSKYLLFDIDTVTWLRREHNICGVTGGTLPQSPSQNLFLGLPLQIMPEEAQLLVDKGVGYIVDDARVHDHALRNADIARHAAYLSQLHQKGERVSLAREEEKAEAKRQSLKKAKSAPRPKSKSKPKQRDNDDTTPPPPPPTNPDEDDEGALSLFDSSSTIKPSTSDQAAPQNLLPHGIVPTTSDLFLPAPPPLPPSRAENLALLPNVPPSYALYKHLNSRSYFMTPGLRFGCQYCVYPGDPLRFHSHFLAVGKQWDEEIDLLDVVGGGRLGTGVKKAFLIGGREEPPLPSEGASEEVKGRVRTFSIEWAAM